MKTTRNAVAVGVVTIAILAGLYVTLRFVSETSEMDGQYRVWAVFPDASGLVEGSRVRIAGIPVGYIDKIHLYDYEVDAGLGPDGKHVKETVVGARVDIVVGSDVLLFENARALKAAGGLLGDMFVVLVPGDRTADRLEDGDQILDTGEAGLLGSLDEISSDISEVTANLKTVFGSEEGGKQMGEVLANLRDISVSINKLLEQNTESVNRTLDNIDKMTAETRPGLVKIVDDLQAITADVRVFVDKNAGTADDAISEADMTIKEVRAAVAKLDRALENLGDLTEGVNEGEGTVGRLLKDDKLIDDVEGVVENAGEFVDDLTRLRTIVGLAGEFNFYDNTLKTTLQLRLQPREDKYYLIEGIYDPRGSTTRKETVIESTNPDDPPQWRETRTKTTEQLLFSFMFARRLRFATFRFGIKESSGGLGLDIHLLRDRVELSTDLYRFGDDVYPRLKAMVAMEFLRHLYIIGGINDTLNENRDYFIGAMLRFDDEDLKTMLAFAPTP